MKNPPAVQEMWVRPLSQEDLLKLGMATLSSILAWDIPWTEELWWTTVSRVSTSQTRLQQLSTLACVNIECSTQVILPSQLRASCFNLCLKRNKSTFTKLQMDCI